MRIEIDKDGRLRLERAGKMKTQFCPHEQGDVPCGDWCPMFHEPRLYGEPPSPGESAISEVDISLCYAMHSCKQEEFSDMRASNTGLSGGTPSAERAGSHREV